MLYLLDGIRLFTKYRLLIFVLNHMTQYLVNTCRREVSFLRVCGRSIPMTDVHNIFLSLEIACCSLFGGKILYYHK